MMGNIENLQGLSIEDIARTVHKGQLYGNGVDYVDGHLIPVKDKALEIADTVFDIKDEKELKQIEILAYLHDAPEDTRFKGKEIALVFGAQMGEDAEALNKNKLNGAPKTKDEYYSAISENIRRVCVKVADRFFNVSMIGFTSSRERSLWWYEKYSKDHFYYEKYNIAPDLLYTELVKAQETLTKKGRL